MTSHRTPITILMADDAPDDIMLTAKAFSQCRLANELKSIGDGEELMDYLLQRGTFASPEEAPHPELIFLDINIPRMDGREAIREIKGNPEPRQIPVIVLTTSQEDRNIPRSDEQSVNSDIIKPVTFDAIAEVIRGLGNHWLEIVALPPPSPASDTGLEPA
jgi:CheY-like chemotaxis protein